MAALRWNDVAPPSSQVAANLMAQGNASIAGGFQGLQDMLKNRAASLQKTATDNALGQVYGITDPKALTQAASAMLLGTDTGIDKRILMDAVNQQGDRLITNEGKMLDQQGQRMQNNVFMDNNTNQQNNLKASTEGTVLKNDYQKVVNKVAPEQVQAELNLAQANVAGKLESNKQLEIEGRTLAARKEAELKTAQSNAERLAIEAKYAEQMQQLALAQGNQSIAASKASVANDAARLSLSRQAAAAKASSNSPEASILRNEARDRYMKALASGDQTEIATSLANLIAAGEKSSDANNASSILDRMRPESKSEGSSKLVDDAIKFGDYNPETANRLTLMAQQIDTMKELPNGEVITPSMRKDMKIAAVERANNVDHHLVNSLFDWLGDPTTETKKITQGYVDSRSPEQKKRDADEQEALLKKIKNSGK